MQLTYNEKKVTRSFPFYLRRSFYFHLGLVLLTLFGGKVILEKRRLLESKNLEIIEASVRVDVVAMPKYTLEELKNLSSGEDVKEVKEEVQEVVKKEEPKEEAIVDAREEELAFKEAAEVKRKSFLDKLKNISAQKKNKADESEVEKGANGEKKTALKDLVLAGNKLSTGTASFGNGAKTQMTQFGIYVSKLPDKVRPHWRLPSFLSSKKLKCRVRIWLDMNGRLINSEIYESSGDSEYDQRAMNAVSLASPFPKLSDDFGKRAMNGDIVLGFPL